MRPIASILFILTLPLVVLSATILYGGISKEAIKAELSNSKVYDLAISQLKNQNNPSEIPSDNDPTTTAIMSVIGDKLNGDYLKGKTEKLIDDTIAWMKNQTAFPPSLSFSDIKSDILSKNPDLLNSITNALDEVKKQQANLPPDENGNTPTPDNSTEGIKTFIKNDFTFPLEKNLMPLKQTYKTITIVLPVLLILCLLYLFVLFHFSKTIRQKMLWIGMTLLLSSLYGFGYVIGGSVLFAFMLKLLSSQTNTVVIFLTPIITNLATIFVDHYKNYQTIVSGIEIVVFVLCLAGALILKPTVVTEKKSSTKKLVKK